jgi:hypothetical protein
MRAKYSQYNGLSIVNKTPRLGLAHPRDGDASREIYIGNWLNNCSKAQEKGWRKRADRGVSRAHLDLSMYIDPILRDDVQQIVVDGGLATARAVLQRVKINHKIILHRKIVNKDQYILYKG